MTGRVLFVVNQGAYFVSHRLQVADAARDAGYEVHVAIPTGEPEAEQLRAHGLVVHFFPLDRRSVNPLGELRIIANLIALYRKVRPDLVHHISVKPVLYGSIAARVTAVPAVVNAVSGLGFLFISDGRFGAAKRSAALAAYRLALRHPNLRVIFQNVDDRAAFLDAGVLRDDQTVLIAGSGVDLQEFRPSPEPTGTPVVMLTGRMLWHKGVGEFVSAARMLRTAGVQARFALVGGTDVNRASVPEEQLHAWEAEGVVEWWGRRTDMPDVVASATVICLPSYREGVPKALLEAAAVGRAMVTTDSPGCRDVVRDEYNGLLVPVRATEELAVALRRLLAAPAERQLMARRSLERAVLEFDVSFVIRATLDLYVTLLGRADKRIAK